MKAITLKTIRGIFLFILLIPSLAQAYTESFYVCNDGDGSQPETATCATAYDAADFNTSGNWDTDDSDDGKIGPNDVVYIMDDGGTYTSTLTVQKAGTSGNVITLTAQSGDTVVFQPTANTAIRNYQDYVTLDCTAGGGTMTFNGDLTPSNPARILNFTNSSYITINGCVVDGSTTEDGGTPTPGHTGIHTGETYDTGDGADFINITNNTIRDLAIGIIRGGSYQADTVHTGLISGNIVERMVVAGGGDCNECDCIGLQFLGTEAGGNAGNIVIENNKVSDCADDGIDFYTSYGATVRYNEVGPSIDPGVPSNANGIKLGGGRHPVTGRHKVYGNYIHDIPNRGITSNGAGSGSKIWGNLLVNTGTTSGSAGIFINNSSGGVGGDFLVYNNTVVCSASSDFGIQLGANDVNEIYLKNNIVDGPCSNSGIHISNGTSVAIYGGYNIVSDFAKVTDGSTGVGYNGAADDLGFTDPLLNTDYSLQPDSPAIDAGIYTGLSDDKILAPGSNWPDDVVTVDPYMDGTQREIGAFVYEGNTVDNCPSDPLKTEPGICGCGISDADSDNDGIPDCNDVCPNDPGNDVDSDGICAFDDNCPTIANPNQADTDADGIGDACDSSNDTDTDGDGVADAIDNCPAAVNANQADSDSDGLGNACDACPTDPGNDVDHDGICGNVDNCPTISNPSQTDSDADGIGDVCDATNNLDLDADGVADAIDNCPAVSNANQADSDSDGLGNACDACPTDPGNDVDHDGICGNVDNCPTVSNPSQADSDVDGIGDACDSINDLDFDADGIMDAIDNCPTISNVNQADIDGDGIGNSCDPVNDLDLDADGVMDITDNCPSTSNADQADSDNDGIGDVCDDCPNDPVNDADGDGVCSDLDGCPFNEYLTEPGLDGCNLPEDYIAPGTNIEVATCADVTLEFNEVTSGGFVNCTVIPDTQAYVFKKDKDVTTANLQAVSSAYDIDFTGTFDGIVTVCFGYDESTIKGKEKNLRLFHSHNGSRRENLTTIVDTENNIICGETTQFSEFGLADISVEPVVPVAASDSDGWGVPGCFIATAAYGSYIEPHVMTLRHLRDTHLLTNKLGTSFVHAYYRYSPPIADYIAEHDVLRSVVRVGLTPLVGFSWIAMTFGIIPALLSCFFIFVSFLGITGFVLVPRRIKN